MIVRDPIVQLDGRACSTLARVLGPLAKPERAGGVDRDLLAIVAEVCAVGRAWRSSTAALGSAAVPQRDSSVVGLDDEVDDSLTTQQAALRLGCQPRNIRDLAERGKLPGDKRGSVWFFTIEAVERYRTERRVAPSCATPQ